MVETSLVPGLNQAVRARLLLVGDPDRELVGGPDRPQPDHAVDLDGADHLVVEPHEHLDQPGQAVRRHHPPVRLGVEARAGPHDPMVDALPVGDQGPWSGGWAESPSSSRSARGHTGSMQEIHFDEHVAARYDEDSAARFDRALVEATVGVLAELAGDGDALELGVGTGRIALPLSRAGVRVHGIDISAPMVDRLRAKPGADAIGVALGDFATTQVDGAFGLVYLVFNTIMNLTSQDEQVECFRNAAAHLDPGGCFVIEVMIPQLQRLPPGETVRPFAVTPTHLGFDEYGVAEQTLVSHHYQVGDADVGASSQPFRYVWPAELDLMARIAGMRLRHRWSDWHRSPFTDDSTQHVSVWEK